MKAKEVRQSHHRVLFEQHNIEDEEFTRVLSDYELALLREVRIDDTEAYTSGFDRKEIVSTCEEPIHRLKDFHVKLC